MNLLEEGRGALSAPLGTLRDSLFPFTLFTPKWPQLLLHFKSFVGRLVDRPRLIALKLMSPQLNSGA